MKAKIRRWLYARNCARKVLYRDLLDATQAAEQGDDGLHAYRCPLGTHYHVGHSTMPVLRREPVQLTSRLQEIAPPYDEPLDAGRAQLEDQAPTPLAGQPPGPGNRSRVAVFAAIGLGAILAVGFATGWFLPG